MDVESFRILARQFQGRIVENKYEVLSGLGFGTFGAVFLATGFDDDDVTKREEYGGGLPDVSTPFGPVTIRGCPKTGRFSMMAFGVR